MKPETTIKLNKFKPREYQKDFCIAFDEMKYKRYLCVWPRRSGKDICAFNLMLRAALKNVGVYFYCLPTFAQARKVIWDSITNSGQRFIDFIPKELVESTNTQQMQIKLMNGSLLQLIGSDSYDTALVGTNPKGIIYSEFALADIRAYQYARPILTANEGWACFLSTPRGKNHLFELYQIAKQNDDWFCSKLTIDDTGHIPLHEIEKEKHSGEMSEDLILQEYYTSFDMGVEGSYYAKYMDRMRLDNRISIIPWESAFKVNTSWDLGVRDSMVIIFYQIIGQTIKIIDYYENQKEGFEHYIKVVNSKPYVYGKHFAPHDIGVTEMGTGMTRYEKARQLGLRFEMRNDNGRMRSAVPDVSIIDGIESVRSAFSKIWIDEVKCAKLIKALENYRQEYDIKKRVYKQNPLHDWSSHACFTGDTLILTRSGMRQIMDITENEEVLTLSGWTKCTKAFKTQINAKLVEVTFTDGMKVKCTPDHLYLTTNGWKSAENLKTNSKIQSGLTNSLSTLMENCIVYGQMRSIFLQAAKDSIERCGKTLLEQYQRIVTYITKTMIPLTTISGISNVYQHQSILKFLDHITQDFLTLLGKKRDNGINPKLEDYGISDKLKDLKVGRSGGDEQVFAFLVNQSLRVLYGEMGINKNSATLTAKLPTIASVKLLKERADVWDITVPQEGHFSLSNGAIAHNCDAMRYLCVSLSLTREGTSAAEIDKRYAEAMGWQPNMPAVFREEIR